MWPQVDGRIYVTRARRIRLNNKETTVGRRISEIRLEANTIENIYSTYYFEHVYFIRPLPYEICILSVQFSGYYYKTALL